MNRVLKVENIGAGVRAFFTGKNPGADFDKIAEQLSFGIENIYMPVQRHTDNVHILGHSLEPVVADAVITNRKGVLIGVQVADCLPVLLYDSKRHVMAAVHAGWRGTAAGILKKTIKSMNEKYFSDSSDMIAAIGPGIGLCCYEVGHEVVDAVIKATGTSGNHRNCYIEEYGKFRLDLRSANRYQAISMGVPENNIRLYDECTCCLPDRYYSYRYSKGHTGRQGGFIGII